MGVREAITNERSKTDLKDKSKKSKIGFGGGGMGSESLASFLLGEGDVGRENIGERRRYG